jgi:hypothetical protein
MFEERVQKLLPFMLHVHEGGAVPFLVPALLHVASEDFSTTWMEVLLNPEVSRAFFSAVTASQLQDRTGAWWDSLLCSANWERCTPHPHFVAVRHAL